ncbi:MAG: ACT domain-containing protein [Ruminococcaceae bacterium]|nr:ACT domain-containing protein [Oscillospiraceae bacterium]
MATKPSYLLVDTSVLPDIFEKVVEAKRLLKTGKCKTASEAAQMLKISRSAFYKYKDCVFPIEEMGKDRIITLFMELVDIPGILSQVLKTLAQACVSVLTINQNIPVDNSANVTISLRTEEMNKSVEALLKKLKAIDGVKKIEIIAGE